MIAWERIDNIKYVLTEPEEIPELMYKLREDVRNIREELAEYIDSPIWNCTIFFYDEDEEYTIQYREYFEKSPDAVTTVLTNEEPEYSLSMGYKHPNITPEMESDEIIKFGVEELVPIPNEYEVTSEDKRECDVPVCENSPIFNDHSEIFSDFNNDDISSDDDAFEDIDINRLIANIESLNDNPTPDCVLKSSASFPIFEESDNSFSDNFSPDLETFSDQTKETRSGSTTTHDSLLEYGSFCFEIELDQERLINIMKNDISDDSSNNPLLEEVDLFLASDNSIPQDIENFGDDSKRDIRFLEELLIDDSIPFPNNESLDFEDDPLFPRPPPKPPDDEFGFEPNSGEEISAVMNNNDEPIDDECFYPGGEIDVSTNVEYDDYFPFIFVI
nr:hypothetical protein [Tanacetum cinerariifolium]